MDTQTVAKTILSQLGGNEFLRMTGVSRLAKGVDNKENPFLIFSLPKNDFNVHHFSKVKVTLNGHDLYDISFYNKRKDKLSGMMLDVVTKIRQDVYCDELQDVFELETNLLCTFSPRASNAVKSKGFTGLLYAA